MKKTFFWLIILVMSISVIAVFSFAGCKEAAPAEEAAEEAEPVAEEQYTFSLVCQFAANELINRIIFGMDVAGEDLGVKVNFIAPESGTVPDQVDLLLSVIASKPDGISILITEEAAFQEAIKTINDLGIPWGTFNSGEPVVGDKQLFYIGALAYESAQFRFKFYL